MIGQSPGASTKIAVILLAAGSSSRMGEPKQMLKVEDDFLISRSVKVALQSNANEVIVVLGYRADDVRKLIAGFNVTMLVNEQWEKGMGSSIKCGISYLKNNLFEAGLVMTCDQPLLQSAHLNNLIDTYQQNKNLIVASRYGGSLGIPALFDNTLFDQLLLMDERQGAKKIIQENKSVSVIEFPDGNIDLDTPQDYRAYQQLIDKRKKL